MKVKIEIWRDTQYWYVNINDANDMEIDTFCLYIAHDMEEDVVKSVVQSFLGKYYDIERMTH